MAGVLSFLPAKFHTSSMSSRDRTADPLQHLRFVLETMPGSRKYVFTPATRAEILSELYGAFWGNYAHMFLPNSNSSLPLNSTLSEVQTSAKFGGAGRDDIPSPGRQCTKIFKKGESCFRCKDCALDDSCVLCSNCFHGGNHANHNVSFFIAQQPGGCCDCGDEEAWKVPIGCPMHPPLDPEIRSTPRVTTTSLPSEVQPVPHYPYRVPIPPELMDSMRRTVGYALDFILDTLDYSPDESVVPASEADLRLQPSADPMMKDVYNIILWNDDKHSFDEVTKLISTLTNRTREDVQPTVRKLDDNGRVILELSASATKLLDIAQSITQIDLGVTIRRAYDTFREQISEVIIEWLLDLTRSRLGTDGLVLREVIAAEMLTKRKRDTNTYNNHSISVSLDEVEDPTRMDVMFLYHTRLWKKQRLSIKEIYASIISLSNDHKLTLSGRFANVYHRVIDAYLLVDREAETSIKYFALQLFTVPSVSVHIVKHHGLVDRLLAIITSFFTNQIVDKHIVYPPAPGIPLDVDSFPFKSKRFMPVFSDLRYLCHTDTVQQLIAQHSEYIDQFAKTCQLFMCVNPNKRVVSSHVEYETDAWISVFNVTLSLSRVIKVYGSAFSKASTARLVEAISIVIDYILRVCTHTEDRLDKNKFPPPDFHDVVFGDTTYEIVQFEVLQGWVSFHHSLHWLLAELFKHVTLLSDENLNKIGSKNVRDLLLKGSDDKAILLLIDYPLRVLAMIAQIRTGLWVRNGFAIRGQLLHYRDYMLRELCYDQDLFMLQVALTVSEPDVVLVSILDRFGLREYFSTDAIHSQYDGAQLTNMVEEVLYVLITILSESASPSRMPITTAVRREIVHALAMGPCSYTDLAKRVAERLVEDVCFERALKEVATFRAPESATDTGTYELKDEAFDEVNPFFYHYTRNKREEVENILRARLKKKSGNVDAVIVPKPFGVSTGPFAIIPATFESKVLLQIMFYALYNTVLLGDAEGPVSASAEAIMDQAMHLVMLALVDRKVEFSQLSAVKNFEEDKSIINLLCALEHHEKFKAYQARVQWILRQMEDVVPAEVTSRRRTPEVKLDAPNPEDAKKKAAKARQEAIMQQMKQQQASFAVNFDDAEEDEDEEMEVEEEASYSFGTCIVCQEECDQSRPFGALGLIQPSRFVRRHPDSHNAYLNEVLETAPSLDRPSPTAKPPVFPPTKDEVQASKQVALPNFDGFPAPFTRFGLVSSVCSHLMHLECFQQYSQSVRSRHRSQATRNHPEAITRKEYICPLCKSLGNIMLPVNKPSAAQLSEVAFPDWIRMAGINILKSKPDSLLESLQFRNGTGEFVFWSAQDAGTVTTLRAVDRERQEGYETLKMVETVFVISKNFSQQTRHLRDRPEPELGERGAGIYMPEELIGYTIAQLEIAQRGNDAPNGLMVDNLSESQMRMIRGHITCLERFAAVHFRTRPDEGRDAIRQAIIKRLLPEWSRTSLTSFSYPLLLRDPFTILVETAAVAPEILNHVLILTYYACLARTVIGLVYILNKTRSYSTAQVTQRSHEDIFGDVRMFFMSVVRHSPVFEHTATLAFETFGEARIERLLYAFTLQFLRRASVLCRAVMPNAFPTPAPIPGEPEYNRLLRMLRIPPLSTLPQQDTIQNALSGWCAHYGHSHAASQLNCGVVLDFPSIYRLARLPVVLDNLFGQRDKALTCARCQTIPIDAAICLICGTTVCMQSNCCLDTDFNNRGECNLHTRECGGAIGMYFLVKRCSLLYLFANNGTFALSPYLDGHGEIDISMRRGRRQFLHHARWEEARKIWLNHQIPTVVARKLESSLDSGGWETL